MTIMGPDSFRHARSRMPLGASDAEHNGRPSARCAQSNSGSPAAETPNSGR